MSALEAQYTGIEPLKDPLDEKIAQIMAKGGITQAKTAEQLNINRSTVNIRLKKLEVQERIKRLRRDIDEEVQLLWRGAYPDAVKTIIDIASGKATMYIIDEEGEKIEIPADSKQAGNRLKAALEIIQHNETKKLPPQSEKPGRRSPQSIGRTRSEEDMREAIDKVSF